jgi:hypothetical protein
MEAETQNQPIPVHRWLVRTNRLTEDVYVLDVNGREHRMELVSVVMADDGCKK